MKKVKYLLGILIVGVGLLFNQSFGIDVEVVSSQFPTTFEEADYTYSYSYLYRFNTLFDVGRGCSSSATNPGGCFGNAQYSNKQEIYNQLCTWNRNISYVPSYNYVFNNSIFNTEYFTGWLAQGNFASTANANCNQGGDGVKVLFGKNQDFGKNALYLNCYLGGQNCGGVSPKYFVGGGSFFSGQNFTEYFLSDIGNSFRVFFNSSGGVNNLTNSNLITPDYWPSSFSWEYFTNRQTNTNFGYIIDTNGYKGKHFGSMGMGYSFVYNKDLSLTGQQISWNTLGFSTVSDDVLVNLRAFGGIDLINNNSLSSFTDGILIFRKLQYTTNGNEGIIVVSKNPDNVKQLLFQEFSCQTNNFQCIAKGLTGSDGNLTNYCPSYIINNESTANNPCLILSQGLLSYNGSTDILPFSDKISLVNISDNNLLSYFFNTSESMLGSTYFNGDSFCIGDDPTGNGLCFEKVESSNSIKENYLNGGVNVSISSMITSNILAKCLNDFDYQMRNPFLCSAVSQNMNTAYALGTGYYYQYSVDSFGNVTVEIIDQAGLFNGHQTVWLQDGSGNWVTNCTGGWCNPNASNVSGSQFLSGDILTEEYYNGTGLFFACPYPTEPLFDFNGWDLKLGKFDILGPINCFISAFKHGKSYNFFDNHNIYDFGPLISGDTQDHRILFRFFDFLLIIGFVLFFSLLYKRFK